MIKILKNILKILVVSVLSLLLVITAVTAVGTALKNDRQLSPWGTGVFIVTSGSMEPVIPVGSFIFVKSAKAEDIKAGDIVTYFSQNEEDIITHRVREVIEESDSYTYITRGDANNTDDSPLTFDRVIGKSLFTVPGAGFLVSQFRDIRLIGISLVSVGVIITGLGIWESMRKKRSAVPADDKDLEQDI